MGEFYRVKCENCKNEQIIFSKIAMPVKCLVCEKILAEPTGGKTKFHSKIIEVIC